MRKHTGARAASQLWCWRLPKLHPNSGFIPKVPSKISSCIDGIMEIELKWTKPNKLTWWHLLLERVLIRVQIKAAAEWVVAFKLMRYLPNPLSQTILRGFTELQRCRLMWVKCRVESDEMTDTTHAHERRRCITALVSDWQQECGDSLRVESESSKMSVCKRFAIREERGKRSSDWTWEGLVLFGGFQHLIVAKFQKSVNAKRNQAK